MKKRYIFAIYALSLVMFAVLTVSNSPVKIIHPDTLRFMAIFQEQFDTINSVGEVPRAIWSAIVNANKYDLYRGRLTNYLAFGVEALIRGYLPFPFVSLLSMLVVIVNAILLAKLVTRGMVTTVLTHTLAFFSVMVLLINPIVIASYEMQFIYPKYLCVTFMLIFVLFERRYVKYAALVGAVFSDEIGVLFTMIVVFLYIFNKKVNADGLPQAQLKALLKPISLGVITALSLLIIYFAILKVVFGKISTLIIHGGFTHKDSSSLKIIESSIESMNNILSTTFGAIGIVILVLAFTFSLYKLVKEPYFQKLFSEVEESQWRIYLLNTQTQEMIAAIFMMVFITYKMYQGEVMLIYYSYPVYMLLMFAVLSLMFKKITQRFLAITLFSLMLSSILNISQGFAFIRNEAANVWIVDKTVTLESFRALELIIEEAKNNTCISVNDLHKAQDNNFDGQMYTYGDKYFPALGIVKVLAWPHKISECTTSYLPPHLLSPELNAAK